MNFFALLREVPSPNLNSLKFRCKKLTSETLIKILHDDKLMCAFRERMVIKVDKFSSTSPLPETKVADVCEIGESRLRSVMADDTAMSEDRARLCFYLFPLARPDP